MEKEVSAGFIMGLIFKFASYTIAIVEMILMTLFGVLMANTMYNGGINYKLGIIPMIIVLFTFILSIVINTINLKYNGYYHFRNLCVEVIRETPNNVTGVLVWLGIGFLINGLFNWYLPAIGIGAVIVAARFAYVITNNVKKEIV